MKKIMKHLIAVLFITSIFTDLSVAQDHDGIDMIQDGELVHFITRTELKGSPYLYPDWLQGHVIVNNNSKTDALPLRYNTETNTIEYRRNNETYILESNTINGFVIYTDAGDITFKNDFYSEKNDINSATFLRVIYNGQTKLLAHHSARLNEDVPTYGAAAKQNAYINNVNYYILVDGQLHEVKLEKEEFLNIFSENAQNIEEYATSSNLSFETEAGVSQIIRYYDQTR